MEHRGRRAPTGRSFSGPQFYRATIEYSLLPFATVHILIVLLSKLWWVF